jgi:hypothetical protein
MKYVLEIRKCKDCSLKKKKELKATNFSEALDEQAEYDKRLSERVYSHIREI